MSHVHDDNVDDPGDVGGFHTDNVGVHDDNVNEDNDANGHVKHDADVDNHDDCDDV